jgi:hypothetical protein
MMREVLNNLPLDPRFVAPWPLCSSVISASSVV